MIDPILKEALALSQKAAELHRKAYNKRRLDSWHGYLRTSPNFFTFSKYCELYSKYYRPIGILGGLGPAKEKI